MKGLQYKFFQCNSNFVAEAFKETVDATLKKKTCLFKKRYVGAKQAFFINQIINKEIMKKLRLRNKVQNSKLKNDVN